LTDAVAATTSATPARALARDLAALVAADDAVALPGFAVIAASDAGTYVKVYGSVEVHLMGPDAEETLTGVGSFTGVDREVAGTFHTIAVNLAGAPVPAPVFDVDVQAGTAPGNGFSITTLTSPTDAPVADVPPATAPAADEAPTVAAIEEPAAPAPAPAATPPPVSSPSSSSEADAVAAMSVVSEPTPAPPAAEVSVSPPADAESNPYTSSASTEAMAAEEAAAATAAAVDPVLDAPTQAWTPSTADFDADDIVQAEAANAAQAPAWGSPEPDAAEPDAAGTAPSLAKAPADDALAPDGGFAATAIPEAPGTPTPPPDGSSLVSPPTAPPPSAPEPVPFDALPVADLPAEDPAPPAFEAATMAIPSAPVAETPAPAADAPPAEFTSQLLGALDDEEPADREALPVETDPGAVRQPDQITAEVHVQGVICSRGHFNDPRSRFCSSCGISMVQNTQILTQGPRPPLGVMVFEDGATFSLSSDYVVGRQPDVSELVQQGLALPLPVDDPERSISRAHAELRLVDWDVHLVNLSGTNGSFVWDENGQQWVPIPEGQSVVLTPGMRVALGRRSAVFESSLVR
ncbi:MAG TPA: FHA domain-containing protein, partial [Iamia sp.]|nr:FHA domain-containing protein [Iamia sp.]